MESSTCLRFEGGDVVLHLSKTKADTLVLPSKQLIAHSDWFKASLKWQEPRLQPTASIPIWQYGLVFDPSIETWTLQSMEKGVEENKDELSSSADQKSLPTLLSTMELSGGDDAHTGTMNVEDVHAKCVEAHKLVFALLFDQPFCLEGPEITKSALMIDIALDLLEYYQLLKPLKRKFEAGLRTNANLRYDIADKPIYYLTIGELLRSRPVFEEAMRHFVGRGFLNASLRPFSSTLLSSPTALLAYKKHCGLLSLLANLSQSLQTVPTLGLPAPIFANPAYRPSIREETRFLARAIWLDWLAAKSASTVEQCAWGGAMWMQVVLTATTKLYEWWKWCLECETRKGDVYASPCRKHGDPTAEVGRWGDAEELKRTGRSTRLKGSDITFLGGAGLVEDILRSYQTRMNKAMLGDVRRELKWCLHEQVRAAGGILLRKLLDEYNPPAKGVDYERFYVTNMRFEKGEMPWEDEEEEEEAEEEEAEDRQQNDKEEAQGEADIHNLEEASENWLRAIGMSHIIDLKIE